VAIIMFRIMTTTIKDSKFWIYCGATLALMALLVSLDNVFISSRVTMTVDAEKHNIVSTPSSSYAHIDSSKWSKAMLRASRSRVSQSMIEQMMEREEELMQQQQPDGHHHPLLLTSSSSSDSYWWQQDFVINDWDSLSNSDRFEIMVNLVTTKWKDLVHFFWNHKFVVEIQVYYS
jgi:hypothetical protein